MQFIDKYIKGDRVIWFVALLLALTSIIAVYGSIITLAVKHHDGNTEYYLFKHGLMVVTGFILMYYAHKLKFRYYSKIGQLGIWVSVGLLALTLAMGSDINNATRWIKIPIINQSFQTSDLAKIVLVLYVARMLSRNRDKIKDFKEGVLPILIPVGIICGLILPANFSTAALLFITCLVLMFVGGVAIKHIGLTIGTGVLAFCLLLMLSSVAPNLLPRATTWKNRVVTFVSGESDETLTPVEKQRLAQSRYQSDEAQMAVYDGSWYPKGPSHGSARNSLPHPYSDMIYAYIIQSYGSILGGIGILLLYLILLFRAIKVARSCNKDFGSYITMGLSFMLVFQALTNMAVAVNLIPVTGQPLPLVSMGGTSTWFTCLAIGIILSVSRGEEEETTTAKSGNYAVA